jgi:hypothetical protein
MKDKPVELTLDGKRLKDDEGPRKQLTGLSNVYIGSESSFTFKGKMKYARYYSKAPKRYKVIDDLFQLNK